MIFLIIEVKWVTPHALINYPSISVAGNPRPETETVESSHEGASVAGSSQRSYDTNVTLYRHNGVNTGLPSVTLKLAFKESILQTVWYLHMSGIISPSIRLAISQVNEFFHRLVRLADNTMVIEIDGPSYNNEGGTALPAVSSTAIPSPSPVMPRLTWTVDDFAVKSSESQVEWIPPNSLFSYETKGGDDQPDALPRREIDDEGLKRYSSVIFNSIHLAGTMPTPNRQRGAPPIGSVPTVKMDRSAKDDTVNFTHARIGLDDDVAAQISTLKDEHKQAKEAYIKKAKGWQKRLRLTPAVGVSPGVSVREEVPIDLVPSSSQRKQRRKQKRPQDVHTDDWSKDDNDPGPSGGDEGSQRPTYRTAAPQANAHGGIVPSKQEGASGERQVSTKDTSQRQLRDDTRADSQSSPPSEHTGTSSTSTASVSDSENDDVVDSDCFRAVNDLCERLSISGVRLLLVTPKEMDHFVARTGSTNLQARAVEDDLPADLQVWLRKVDPLPTTPRSAASTVSTDRASELITPESKQHERHVEDGPKRDLNAMWEKNAYDLQGGPPITLDDNTIDEDIAESAVKTRNEII